MVTMKGKKHRSKKSRKKKKKSNDDELNVPLMDYGSTEVHHDHHDHHAKKEKKEGNVNLSAAYLHVLGDLIQSVAVFLAGLLIMWKPHWQVADPICTIIFSFIVFKTTSGILKSTTNVLLEGVPKGIDWEKVRRG